MPGSRRRFWRRLAAQRLHCPRTRRSGGVQPKRSLRPLGLRDPPHTGWRRATDRRVDVPRRRPVPGLWRGGRHERPHRSGSAMNASGSVAANTALAFAATAASLLVLEAGLRVGGYEYTPLRIEVVKKWSEWRYYHAFEDKHFVYDPVLIWRPRKGGEFFNEQGYRGRVISPVKELETTRIFAIGDSNTLGWPGHDAPNWPMYLEQILNSNGHPSVVVNAGVY